MLIERDPMKTQPEPLICPVDVAIEIIRGKWKGMILIYLMSGTRRFNELKRLLPDISQRMLTNQLRELEADGIINRKVYAEVPPRVEYSLTETGYEVRSVLIELRRLGELLAPECKGNLAPIP